MTDLVAAEEAAAGPEPGPTPGIAPGSSPGSSAGSSAVHSRAAAITLLVLLTLIWGVHWSIVKIGLNYLPPLTYGALRVAIGLTTASVILAAQGRLRLPGRENLPIVLSVGGLQVGASIVMQNLALRVVGAGRSSVLVYSMPLWVAVLLFLRWRFRPTRDETLALVLGVGGLALLLNPTSLDWSSTGQLAGSAGLVLNAWWWAAVIIHIRRHRWTRSPFELMPAQLLVALVPITIAAIVLEGGQTIDWQPATVLILLYSGVLATTFATWAMQSITRALGPQASATGYLVTPVVGLVTGWLILGERLGAADIVGSALVLGGVAIAAALPALRAPRKGS